MRVIVIEDSRTQAEQLRLLLRKHGFDVDVALDGETGLARCRTTPTPVAVISDVVMPGIDGYEVARRIKRDPELGSIPVMLLTSLGDSSDIARAIAAGADNFITKPYRDDRLVRRLRRMIALREHGTEDAVLEIGGERFPLHATKSHLAELLVTSLDVVTERIQELEESEQRLERAKKQREELMRIVAHELRSPLSSLMMSAELATTLPETADIRHTLPETVLRAARRMDRIISDLVDLTNIDLGLLRTSPEPNDLVHVIRESLAALPAIAKSHRIECTMPDRVPVHADARRIEQVVTNYVSNAAKYSRPGSTIQIVVEASGARIRVEVRDEGVGVPAEDRPKVFERYFRTAVGQSSAEGLGLGLHICRSIVRLHGGEVGVESEVGKGSTFWFELPNPEVSA